MFENLLLVALFLLTLSAVAGIYRIIVGPSTPDRVVALDTFGINLIGIIGIVSIIIKTEAFLDIILLIGALAFIGTVAFSKFLEKGVIIERDNTK